MKIEVNADSLKTLLQSLLDFLGTEGVVREEYSRKRNELCARLRTDLHLVEKLIQENE